MSITKYRSVAMRARIASGDAPGWMRRHIRANYIKAAYLAIPPWLSRVTLDEMDDLREYVSRVTGIRHVLAHVVPLNHPRVCGLTVPWNITIVPFSVNANSGNDWNEDQLELWPNSPSYVTKFPDVKSSSYSDYFATREWKAHACCGRAHRTQMATLAWTFGFLGTGVITSESEPTVYSLL